MIGWILAALWVALAYFYGVHVGLRHGRLDCKKAYDLGRDDAIRHLMV